MSRNRRRIGTGAGVVVVALSMSGCGGQTGLAPVTKSVGSGDGVPSIHTVRRGETLYVIAWRYGLDYRDIAGSNRIQEPYRIYPGQELRIEPKAADVSLADAPPTDDSRPKVSVRALPPSAPSKTSRPQPSRRVAKGASKPAPDRPPVTSKSPGPSQSMPKTKTASANGRPITWRWPVTGKIVGAFRKGGRKGINIGGRRGQSIVAASNGRVVYAGGGLIGYGKLIIVKHNKRFLSAYAHNSQVFVKEGDAVTGGQRIAEMGSTGSDKVKLHFEIRRDGKPVNPLRYLPR